MRNRNRLAACALAALLLSAPLELAAREDAAPTVRRVPVVEWIADVWDGLAAWLAGMTVPPSSGSSAMGDGSCAIDPNGGCDHGG
jgi:hypothetical protein